MLATYLAPRVSPRVFFPLALLAIGYPLTVLLNLFFALSWILRRPRLALLSLGAVVAGTPYALCYVGVHRPTTVNGSFRVMTFNADYFSVLHDSSRVALNATAGALTSLVEAEHPAVLCGQDFSGDGVIDKGILATLQGACGLTHVYAETPSLAVLTSLGTKSTQSWLFPDSENSFAAVDVEIGSKTVRVLNLHLQSYGLGVTGGGWLRTALTRLHRGLVMRAEQADEVARQIAASPYPVVVCGDFNDVPLSYAYHRVATGLVDGFASGGWGWGVTYAGPLPMLRIDHILCSPSLRITGYRVLSYGHSDHYPAVCDVSFR